VAPVDVIAAHNHSSRHREESNLDIKGRFTPADYWDGEDIEGDGNG
jgi:hypothetical protein